MKNYDSLRLVQNDLLHGEITCVDLVNGYLSKIESLKHLNAFLEVFAQDALQQAEEIDEKIKNGSQGSLFGLVIALKDNICYAGHRVSASSKILEGFVSQFSSTAVERLLAQDAIIIGRCNCDEFAMGSSTENSAFGPTLNSIDETRVPGGSSGGSAVAVKAGMCLAALGSDTGGSVRQPASFCGVIGYRPSYGMISRYGLLSYASSFDQIGPITKSVDDLRSILSVISGPDERDATSIEKGIDFTPTEDKPKTIGFLKECIEHPNVDPELKSYFVQLRNELEQKGHKVVDVSFQYLDYVVPNYYVLTTAEASSNYSRYAGMTYGYRSPDSTDIESTIVKSRSEGFGEEVKRRIMLGTFVLSAGYYDAYYTKAQKVRRLIQEETDKLFEAVDIIALPTSPGTAFKLGAISDPISMYLEDIFAIQASLAGVPAISMPLHTNKDGLPFGIQFMGPRNRDAALLDFCDTFSQ